MYYITVHYKLSRKVELNFLSSEIVVCYSQEAKYSGYRNLNANQKHLGCKNVRGQGEPATKSSDIK